MRLGLRTLLTLSYVFVALLGILLVSALANGVLEARFRSYVRDTFEKENLRVADLIGGMYRGESDWDPEGLEEIGVNALEQGVIVRVVDLAQRIVWDATEHNSGLCEEMISHMAENMTSRYPNWQGAYTENVYPVRHDFQQVGSISVGYYGPFFLNDEDLAFITALNRLLLWVTLVVLALASGAGLLIAQGLSVPLARVVTAAQAIASGNLDARIPGRSRVREMDRMTAAVNDMAGTLKAQESLRRRLTADMAHEVRTPLAALQSHLEALIDGIWEPNPERLSVLHDEVLRVNRLVSDLENLARYESDALRLDKGRTDVRCLVQLIVANQEPQFRAKGVALAFDDEVTLRCRDADAQGADGGFTAFVDSDKLSQTIINLLSNSLKFTPAGGSVRVSLTLDGPAGSTPSTAASPDAAILVTVADTGIGIGPEDLPRVFDRFYRVDSSRSRSTGGSGVGLSIAQAIIRAHGGSIHAISTLGRGSEFTIRIPRGDLPAE